MEAIPLLWWIKMRSSIAWHTVMVTPSLTPHPSFPFVPVTLKYRHQPLITSTAAILFRYTTVRSWLVSVKVLSVKWSSGEHSGMSGSKSWGFTALQLLSREQLMHCLAAFTARGRYSMLSVWPGKKPSLKRPFLNSKVEISSSHHPGSASQLPPGHIPGLKCPPPSRVHNSTATYPSEMIPDWRVNVWAEDIFTETINH